MGWAGVERLKKRGQVVFMHRPGPVARRLAAGVAAAVVGDHLEGLGQLRHRQLPAAVIDAAAMDQHGRVAAAGTTQNKLLPATRPSAWVHGWAKGVVVLLWAYGTSTVRRWRCWCCLRCP